MNVRDLIKTLSQYDLDLDVIFVTSRMVVLIMKTMKQIEI